MIKFTDLVIWGRNKNYLQSQQLVKTDELGFRCVQPFKDNADHTEHNLQNSIENNWIDLISSKLVFFQ